MRNRKIFWIVAISLIVFAIGITANYFGSIYAIDRASSPVADIVLSNIPVYDVDGAFVFGPIMLWLFFIIVLVRNPQKVPFALEALGLLLVTRAVFVTLTHIGPFPEHVAITYNFLGFFSAGGDLFFSGHTSMPFMMALCFWKDIRLRAIFIGASIFFGAVVLMGHLHYSIDVAAAFFITYTVYHIATIIFKKPLKVFDNGWAVLEHNRQG
ncbi:hypothetical protein KGQ27_01455 [Patescibacteria group bacterium]|nr:hypothetical protein [Patescibacteria group bacterium]MDE1946492.1 hypothetical protein [Patescibacteria group bacterium]MDE2011263.1 hypothetical protein [Patescibacteria group bacterium]MDE2233346.1 hypothetical protein [Patescibacteria group bacterium]